MERPAGTRFLIWDLGFGGMKYGGEVPAVRKVS